MESLKAFIGNYIKLKWVLRCLFFGLILVSVAVGLEVYIRQQSGRPLDDHFFKGMYKGVAMPFLIPIMIYAVVVLLKVYIDLKKYGMELITSFAANPNNFVPSLEAGETIQKDERMSLVTVGKSLPMINRLIFTDRNLFMVSRTHASLITKNMMSGLSSYRREDHMKVPFSDIAKVQELKKLGRYRTLQISLNNGTAFTIRVPGSFSLPALEQKP